MKIVWQILTQLAWALWLGGLIALFVSVLTLFHEDRSLAIHAAPMLFHSFEMYQLVLAGVAIVASVLWSRANRGGIVAIIAVLFIVAAIGAVVSPVFITPKMMQLQRLGETRGARFGELHGESMMIYMGDAVLVAAAGLMLPQAMKRR